MADTELLTLEKHGQILAGAVTVFAQDGYEGASMSRIAAQAGVSKGTLYNYFSSKAELFSALIAAQCERSLTAAFDVTDPDGDPASGLRAIGERMLRMIISPTGLTIYRLVAAEAAKFPDLARAFYEAGPARAKTFTASWLERQTQAGRLCVPDPAFATEQFFILCQTRIAMRCRLGLMHDPSDEAIAHVVDSAVTMFLNTYGAKP